MTVGPSPVDDVPGEITIVDESGVSVLRLRGEIDTLVVAAYDETTADAMAPDPSVIDAAGVTFMDCRGLAFLIRRTQAARRAGRTPVLRRPARIVERVVDVADATALFAVVL